jgi:hypothetical protein
MSRRYAILRVMDAWPAVLALIGVGVGGVIARVGDVLGFFNERKHWLRQQRLAAYTRFFQDYDRSTVKFTVGLVTNPVNSAQMVLDFAEMASDQAAASSAVAVVGPPEVYKSVRELMSSTLEASRDQMTNVTAGKTPVSEDPRAGKARDKTLAAMQRALR